MVGKKEAQHEGHGSVLHRKGGRNTTRRSRDAALPTGRRVRSSAACLSRRLGAVGRGEEAVGIEGNLLYYGVYFVIVVYIIRQTTLFTSLLADSRGFRFPDWVSLLFVGNACFDSAGLEDSSSFYTLAFNQNERFS
jgi:hypothetical protein